jgi:hypothetical protein
VGELDRSQGEHVRPGAGHLEHLVEVDLGQLAGLGNDPRVGGEHAGHVGVDLTRIGVERLGERRRRQVGGAAAHRGDLLVGGDPLEPGDHAHLALGQGGAHPVALDLEDLGLAVRRVGDDPDLAPGEADRVDAAIVERHRHECRGDALTGGEQHVHLAAGLRRGNRVGERDQVVGGLAHRRDDHHDVVAVASRDRHVLGTGADAIGVGHRGAAVLLDEQSHGFQSIRARPHGRPEGSAGLRRGGGMIGEPCAAPHACWRRSPPSP